MTIVTKKTTIYAIASTVIALAILTPIGAIAGTYSPNFDQPDSCTGSSNACATADSSGVNKLVVKSSGVLVLKEADAFNNQAQSSNPGSNPQVTIINSEDVDFSGHFTGKGFHDLAAGANGAYEYTLQIWKNDATWGHVTHSEWLKDGTITTDDTITLVKSTPNLATNVLEVSGKHHLFTWNGVFGGISTIDYWNGATRHATTNELCINTTCN